MVFTFWVSTLKFVSQIILLLAYVLLKIIFLIITLVTDSPPSLSYKPDPSILIANVTLDQFHVYKHLWQLDLLKATFQF